MKSDDRKGGARRQRLERAERDAWQAWIDAAAANYAIRLSDLTGVDLEHSYDASIGLWGPSGNYRLFDHPFSYRRAGSRSKKGLVLAGMPYIPAAEQIMTEGFNPEYIAKTHGVDIYRDQDHRAWWNPGFTRLYLATALPVDMNRVKEMRIELIAEGRRE